jgi:endonuclease-3
MAAKKKSLAERKKRAGRILAGLHKLYPDADCALEHKSALQLLVATILSAQSTDETVNKVTPVLFARFPSADALAGADRDELERFIRQTGFFRQKAKSVQNASAMIMERFGGRVPDSMDELVQLPGVARKTANVVLGTWFKKNEGVVVDTHVGRLAVRLGLTWTGRNEKDAVRIENDLMEILPRKEWTFAGHALIWHGRRVCTARKPNCAGCTLNKFCPSAFSFDGKTKGNRKPARTAAKAAAARRKTAGRRATRKR